MANTDAKPLGHPPEVGEYLGVPVKTLYAWNHAKKGPPAIRIGKHLRYRWEDVDNWIDEQRDDRG